MVQGGNAMSTAPSAKASRRSYEQGCGIAIGLDFIGERWSLLIIRELLVRPVRFSDLFENLQGISPTLLSERLRFLQAADLITRRDIHTDGRSHVYLLTERGEALRPMMLELAKWGLANATSHLGTTRPEWAGLAMEAMARGRHLPSEVTETYCFEIDDFLLYIVVSAGEARVTTEPPAHEPTLIVRSSASTITRIGMKHLNPLTALASKAITVEGPADAFENCGRLLGLID